MRLFVFITNVIERTPITVSCLVTSYIANLMIALSRENTLTKLSTRGERFTGSTPQIKTLAASLDLEYSAILRDFPYLTRP
ncbi:hypothetical protein TNCV_1624861 [Trichonephila clavipes]|nr:hypothetical protein TNCV_1624861 [Trichonephila clavipes]